MDDGVYGCRSLLGGVRLYLASGLDLHVKTFPLWASDVGVVHRVLLEGIGRLSG
jgi:hypothetical protein